jgi:hypothetical protein
MQTGRSTTAMYNAASMGLLYFIKWFYENRTEGCTTTAMDNAAIDGHFDLVKCLHVNRS